jgi:hypothetical protein
MRILANDGQGTHVNSRALQFFDGSFGPFVCIVDSHYRVRFSHESSFELPALFFGHEKRRSVTW